MNTQNDKYLLLYGIEGLEQSLFLYKDLDELIMDNSLEDMLETDCTQTIVQYTDEQYEEGILLYNESSFVYLKYVTKPETIDTIYGLVPGVEFTSPDELDPLKLIDSFMFLPDVLPLTKVFVYNTLSENSGIRIVVGKDGTYEFDSNSLQRRILDGMGETLEDISHVLSASVIEHISRKKVSLSSPDKSTRKALVIFRDIIEAVFSSMTGRQITVEIVTDGKSNEDDSAMLS